MLFEKMEQKKQLLIEILKKLEGHRELATGFLIIVEKTGNEKIINQLLKLIQKGIKSIKEKTIRTKLINRIKELQKKGDKEQEESNNETENLLEDFINNMEK